MIVLNNNILGIICSINLTDISAPFNNIVIKTIDDKLLIIVTNCLNVIVA